MIVEKLRPTEVYSMKLVTGEEIITRFTEDSAFSYRIYKPLVLSITAQGVAMTPFMFTAEIEGNIDIPKSAVIAIAVTDKSTAGQYIQGTTGIVPVRSTADLGKLL
jgi:hypothetical protein